MKKIVIFASGSGSNAENLITYFKGRNGIEVSHVFTNNPKAMVIERCKRLDTPCVVFDRAMFSDDAQLLQQLQAINPDLIVLAGFLWMIPKSYINAFPNRIINVHPALLPKFGGKGMYGRYVHEAVIASAASESGITIHYVNPRYDEGAIIFQAKCAVNDSDTVDTLTAKIHELEMKNFPAVVESLLTSYGETE